MSSQTLWLLPDHLRESDDLDLRSNARMTRDVNHSLKRAPCQEDRDASEAYAIILLCDKRTDEFARRTESHEVMSVKVVIDADLSN
jgi:hypothetical protein